MPTDLQNQRGGLSTAAGHMFLKLTQLFKIMDRKVTEETSIFINAKIANYKVNCTVI